MSGSLKSHHAPDDYRRETVTHFYKFIAVALVTTVLAVLFIPGVDEFIEQTFQRYLGRAAR